MTSIIISCLLSPEGIRAVYLQIALMGIGSLVAMYTVLAALRPMRMTNPFYV